MISKFSGARPLIFSPECLGIPARLIVVPTTLCTKHDSSSTATTQLPFVGTMRQLKNPITPCNPHQCWISHSSDDLRVYDLYTQDHAIDRLSMEILDFLLTVLITSVLIELN